MKILIVKLSSIGDIIHTLPVLSVIRSKFVNADITWVVEKNSAEILRGNPLIEDLIEVDTKTLRKKDSLGNKLNLAAQQFKKLRATKFDVVLDFQGLWKSAAIAKLARAKKRFGFAKEALREPSSRFLLSKTFSVEPKSNIIRKNLTLVAKALQISVPENNFEFPIATGENHKLEAAEIASKINGDFVIINPATSWVTKLWRAEKYGQLADKLWEKHGLFSVVTTAPNEKNLAQKVLNASKSGKIISTTPTLKGFYELAKLANIYIGGDTGPMFLAVAAKTPIVGIFGPTEWWRNGSPNVADIGVERNDIGCRVDCHRRTCSNWICMDIEVETVLEAVENRLSRMSKVKSQKSLSSDI